MAKCSRDRLHLKGIPEIRLVGPVHAHRVLVGDPGNVRGYRKPVAEFFEHPPDHRLDRLEHVVLRHEAHFHVELIEVRGRAVGTGIFITETRGNLEVPVETGNHDHLLEQLGSLREGVEFSGMQSRRHQEVPRPLG